MFVKFVIGRLSIFQMRKISKFEFSLCKLKTSFLYGLKFQRSSSGFEKIILWKESKESI